MYKCMHYKDSYLTVIYDETHVNFSNAILQRIDVIVFPMYVCMYVCMHVCTYVLCMYANAFYAFSISNRILM